MSIIQGLTAAAIVAGGAVCFASPVRADDFSGAYLRTGLGTQSTWFVTPCGPGCAHVADSSGWSADAHMVNGQWTFSIDRPDATRCRNGSWAPGTSLYSPGTSLYSVDAGKLAGTVVTSNPVPCELAAGYSTPIYFTLTKAA